MLPISRTFLNEADSNLAVNGAHMNLPPDSPRPSRLAKCPCGSGRRFKDCHGKLDQLPGIPYLGAASPEMVAVVREHERKQRDYEARHGKVRPIITVEFAGHRLVAVGSKLHWAKESTLKIFPDFLNQYLHSILGKEWGAKQVALEFEKQGQIVQWRTIWTTRQQQQKPDADGLYTSDSGAGLAWFRLAYDLYLLEHHDELQRNCQIEKCHWHLYSVASGVRSKICFRGITLRTATCRK